MNPIIKEQLKKVKVAVLPAYTDNTVHLCINMGIKSEKAEELQVGHKYSVIVDDSLVDKNNSWYKTIHGNWNGGVGLEEKSLIITVEGFVGKMVKVSAVGIEKLFYTWSGYLPKSNIGMVEEMD